MWFVYVLKSLSGEDRYYTGFTGDLRRRVRDHNAGYVESTKDGIPWELKNFVGFREEGKAREFERYLKSSSGRAFARKRF